MQSRNLLVSKGQQKKAWSTKPTNAGLREGLSLRTEKGHALLEVPCLFNGKQRSKLRQAKKKAWPSFSCMPDEFRNLFKIVAFFV